MFLCCFYYFNVVLCLVMLVCNDILAITMFCILLCCFVQLQYCFCFLIFFYLLLVILQCYNIPILLFLVQFCIVSCYIVGSCFILFCFVFSNVTLLFFNVTTSFFVLVSRFVLLYYCFYCYNVVLCVMLLFCIDTTLFYSLKYRIVSYYVNL